MVKIFGITSHNDILKCDKCKIPFSSYDQPKSLACGETICSACSVEIEKEAINKKFKCILCLEEHTIVTMVLIYKRKTSLSSSVKNK